MKMKPMTESAFRTALLRKRAKIDRRDEKTRELFFKVEECKTECGMQLCHDCGERNGCALKDKYSAASAASDRADDEFWRFLENATLTTGRDADGLAREILDEYEKDKTIEKEGQKND